MRNTYLTDLNLIGRNITTAIGIADGTKIYKPQNTRITFKDHSTDFQTRLQTILICPSMSNIGKIWRLILDKIIPTLINNC